MFSIRIKFQNSILELSLFIHFELQLNLAKFFHSFGVLGFWGFGVGLEALVVTWLRSGSGSGSGLG